jgi:23S rRNA pseudouridine2604 synthase
MSDDAIRLAKRVAAQVPCSRADAERYIAGGWVTVDGAVAEDPATRVTDQQQVALLAGATATEPEPATIVFHKPAGVSADAAMAMLTQETLEGNERFLKRHVHRLSVPLPLEIAATGLVVYTQDFQLGRRLAEADRFEQEYVAQVTGAIADDGLASLNSGAIKVSWQSEGRLRFAGKGMRPGLVAEMCEGVGLELLSLKRLRIGRVSLAKLPEGRWRFLTGFERF